MATVTAQGTASISFNVSGTAAREDLSDSIFYNADGSLRPKRTVYKCLIEGDEVKISAFDFRMRGTGQKNHVNITIPNYPLYSIAVDDSLELWKGYHFTDDDTFIFANIIVIPITSLSFTESNGMMKVTASEEKDYDYYYYTEFFTLVGADLPPSARDVWTSEVETQTDGKIRIQTGLDFDLESAFVFIRPGDELTYDSGTITAGEVAVNCKPGVESVSVTEK